MTGVATRRITPVDAMTLKRVRLAALHDSPSAFGSTYAAESERPPEEWVTRAREASAGPLRATFFAELEGSVVGLVGGYRDEPSEFRVNLVSMWVEPCARRDGAGRALVQAIVEWARGSAATEVALWVTDGNAPALSLYQSAGFESTGNFQALPSDPTKQELEMVLRFGAQ